MDPLWKSYFQTADFDGDGIEYPYDRYLGREDVSVDFSTKGGGSLIMVQYDPLSFDPLDFNISHTNNMVGKLYDTLIQFVPGTDSLMPCIAKAWEVSADETIYTFYLREGITFSNGEPLTAEDVVYSMERVFEQYNINHINELEAKVISVETLDDTTVRCTLSEPYSPFLAHLANTHFSILSQDYVLESGEDALTYEPMGSGPWILGEYVPDEYLVLDANSHYWAGKPYLDNIVIRFSNTYENHVNAWHAGLVDVIPIGLQEYKDMMQLCPDCVVKKVRNVTWWQIMNCSTWPFNNKAVRQAVTCGIDTEEVLTTLYSDLHMPARCTLPPTMQGFSQALYDSYEFTFDQEKARAILDDAGIIDTDNDEIRELDGRPMVFEFSTFDRYEHAYAADVWSDNLRGIGIIMEHESYGSYELIGRAEEGDFEMTYLGWISDIADASNFFKTFETGYISNLSRYSNETYDALLDDYHATIDQSAQDALSNDMQLILQENCPVVWFYHPADAMAVHEWIHDFIFNPAGMQKDKFLGTWTSIRSITMEADPICVQADGDASSFISLQATYPNGQPLPDNTQVFFSSTVGTLTVEATTIENGYAYTSLISPETAKTALFTARVEGYGTAEIPVFFTNEPTDVSPYQTEYVCNDTLDASEDSDIAVTVDGQATVTVANYTDPPATGFLGTNGDYFDLFIADTSSVNEVELRLYYDEAELGSMPEEDLSISWYDGEQWCVCTPTGVNTDENYIWLLVSDESTPTLEELQGTYFTYGIPNADSILAYIDETITPWGIQNSIEKKIEHAQRFNDRGKYFTAQNILGALINELEAQRGKHIPEDIADYLISTVHAWMEDPSLM